MCVLRLPTAMALFAAVAIALAAAGADDPPPLLRPVSPPNGNVRLQLPLVGASQFKARIPRGGKAAKKGETIEVTVTIDTSSGGGRTTLKTWQSWGYEAEKGGPVVLPELIVSAAQIAPKPAKGHDAELRVRDVKIQLSEYAGDVTPTGGGHLHLGLGELARGGRVVEPRIHLADKFLELTQPNAQIKRPGTDTVPVSEPKITAEPSLVPAAVPTRSPESQLFAFASVNGLTQYKTPDGKIEPVVASFSNVTGQPIILTFRLAHGCGVEMEEPTANWSYLKGKVKELRLAMQTGPGLKTAKDLVLRDIPVLVNSERSHGHVVFGTEFAAKYFKDGIYGSGPDGLWKLHGRVRQDLLEDAKTRTPPKKP